MALAISPAVKAAVWQRDGGRCVNCGSVYAAPEAHFIPRSLGGLGVEENIVTLCRRCHDLFDCGRRSDRESIRASLRIYLSSRYTNWDEKKLIYRKDM